LGSLLAHFAAIQSRGSSTADSARIHRLRAPFSKGDRLAQSEAFTRCWGDVLGPASGACFLVFRPALESRHREGMSTGHSDGVIERTHEDAVALLDGLLLELEYPLQPVQRRQAVEATR